MNERQAVLRYKKQQKKVTRQTYPTQHIDLAFKREKGELVEIMPFLTNQNKSVRK